MPRPLDGLRVIDTSTGPAGGIATMVLADFGADVVKVEPPGGDRFRSLPGSALWLRGKRSATLDLHTADGIDALHSLVRSADVVVVSGPPGRAARWGIDADAATTLRPGIVHCSITGWGEHGPLADVPGYQGVVAARAGRMMAFSQQLPRSGPIYAALPVSVHMSAHAAVQGVLSALLSRDRSGVAGRVTTSLLQCLPPYDLVELLLVQLHERAGTTPVSTAGAMPTLNYHPVRTGDGRWIQCGNLLEHLFLSFLDAIDLYGELLADERFHDSPALWTPDAVEHARDRILETMQTKSADEWMAIFHANGNVAAEPFLTPAQALDHPDLVDNGAIVTIDDPAVGRVRMIGAISTLTATPARIERPAPLVGEHTAALLAEAAAAKLSAQMISAQTISAHTNPPADPTRPLGGITVVEFAAVIAAPLGASMLADLGARVIRVEPLDGDSYRHLLPHGMMATKTTAGKESICLDLKSAEGRAIAQRLIEGADVLIHNYRLGVPERLGIGYDQLHAAHPTLVWCAVNGYGPHGPSRHRPATHPVAGAATGGAGYQAGGALDAPCPTLDDVRENARRIMRANESNPDPNTSAIVASSVLLALVARERTGEGQAVLVDMMTANAHANADAFLSYDAMPARPTIDANHVGTSATDRLYECSDGWVFLAITTDAEWQRFCTLTGEAGLGTDVRFSTVAARRDNDAALAAAVASVLRTRDADAWEHALGLHGVGCARADASTPGPFYAHHEQMLANGFSPVAEHVRFGAFRRWSPIVHVGGGASSYGPGVLAGQHTDALLAELGFDAPAITSLHERGIVASEPTEPYVG